MEKAIPVEANERQKQSTWQFFKGLSRDEWLELAVQALAQLCATVTFSCIVPFFPTEAIQKGLTITQVGLLIGVFQLVSFLASPLLGKFMAQLGPKRLFTGGLLVSGFSAILFGLLRTIPSGSPFFWIALLMRCVKALGSACFATSSFTIVAQTFPGKLASVMGLMELFAGIGYTAGPLLGSALYKLGGFPMPFFVLGSLMLCAALVSVLSRLGQNDNANAKTKIVSNGEFDGVNGAIVEKDGGWRLLAIPEVWLTLWAILTLDASCFFYDASIANHLADLNGGPMLIGLMISLVSGTYLLSAPFCGMLIDRWPDATNGTMLFGSLLATFAILLMGPSPVLPLTKSVPTLCTAFALMGAAISPLWIPAFQHCIRAAKKRGFNESGTGTCGLISGLLQASASLGAFLGATLGGAFVNWLGFGWTCTLVACLHLTWSSAQLLFCILNAFKRRRRNNMIVPVSSKISSDSATLATLKFP